MWPERKERARELTGRGHPLRRAPRVGRGRGRGRAGRGVIWDRAGGSARRHERQPLAGGTSPSPPRGGGQSRELAAGSGAGRWEQLRLAAGARGSMCWAAGSAAPRWRRGGRHGVGALALRFFRVSQRAGVLDEDQRLIARLWCRAAAKRSSGASAWHVQRPAEAVSRRQFAVWPLS